MPAHTEYTTILADPGWQYQDKLTMSDTARGADDHYHTMSVHEICGLWSRDTQQLAGHAIAKDAFLWLWVTNPFILSGVGMTVCRAWGFAPKQIITWIKGRLAITDGSPQLICRTGLGHYTRGVTEHLILGTRGHPKSLVLNHGESNFVVASEETVFVAPPTAHSEKPIAVYEKIERVCPGPYLELFARRRRDGWQSWGDELDK